ncbi:microfibril-associated glycoprotein 4-like [Drosophila innubila]|uniref:microfibril-associated glycoprotein 4-like n=1 Tax=Drosophila innubila TaxID=198719 RepID=UPI00148D77E4|nr:microfibril-associated glycoprotein 4-like [Drosophila innubila]
MVIQIRFDGSVNFNRSWTEYTHGFGHIDGEYFIGLKALHLITTSRPHELLISMKDSQNVILNAHYDHFVIGSEEQDFALLGLGLYSGNAGDTFRYNTNMKFSTYDRDNDEYRYNCAASYQAWWHKACSFCNLNGKPPVCDTRGTLLKQVLIMIRPKPANNRQLLEIN